MEVYIFFRFLSLICICTFMVILEKMDGSSFYAYHSEFYLVQVNTHTDFGGLMQQLDCRTRERMRELFINRKWHHCTTASAKALVGCLGSQYHKNASSALLAIWYLLCSRTMWRKMTNERLRAPLLLDTDIWGLYIEHVTFASESVLLKPTYPNLLMWNLLTVFPVSGIATGVIVVFFVY